MFLFFHKAALARGLPLCRSPCLESSQVDWADPLPGQGQTRILNHGSSPKSCPQATALHVASWGRSSSPKTAKAQQHPSTIREVNTLDPRPLPPVSTSSIQSRISSMRALQPVHSQDTSRYTSQPPPDHYSYYSIAPRYGMAAPHQSSITYPISPCLTSFPTSVAPPALSSHGPVSLPQESPGKPDGGGTIYIYGTANPAETEAFLNVHEKWNAAGTGGDKRGKLLTTASFDDGKCYQVNQGDISTSRQTRFPHEANPPMGADLWCHNLVSIPNDLVPGSSFTLYWVWDWSTMPHVDSNFPKGKTEIYTTCIDIDITATEE